MRFSRLIKTLLSALAVKSLLKVDVAVLKVISYVLEIFTIDSKRIWIVRVNLAKLIPIEVDLFGCLIGFLAQVIQDIKVWHHSSQVSPKLNLDVANLLYGSLHFTKKALKLYHI